VLGHICPIFPQTRQVTLLVYVASQADCIGLVKGTFLACDEADAKTDLSDRINKTDPACKKNYRPEGSFFKQVFARLEKKINGLQMQRGTKFLPR
jgi:hypothetical protein